MFAVLLLLGLITNAARATGPRFRLCGQGGLTHGRRKSFRDRGAEQHAFRLGDALGDKAAFSASSRALISAASAFAWPS
jgi:hypothetical protein